MHGILIDCYPKDALCQVLVEISPVKTDMMSFISYQYKNRKSEQAHITHAPTLFENAVYNEWQFRA